MPVNFLNAMVFEKALPGTTVSVYNACLDLASDTTAGIIVPIARSDLSCVASQFLCMFGPTRVSDSWCL